MLTESPSAIPDSPGMPIKSCVFDSFGLCGGEADFDSSDFINELEFYSTTTDPSDASGPSIMGSTSAALMMTASDTWCKVETMDEETLLSMSPPDPFNYSNWDDVIISDNSFRTVSDYCSSNDNSDVLLTHDCMWGGTCLNCEQDFRTLSRQCSTSCSSNSSSISISDNVNSNNTTRGCSSSSSCNNNSNSSVLDNNLRTGSSSILIQQSQSNSPSSSSSSSNSNNSSCSNNTGSANSSNNITTNSNTKSCVVKTIEVPSVSGPGIVKTGVIVQKTVQKSLLINKAKTKIENNTVNNNKNNNKNNHTNENILVKAKTINDFHSYVNFSSNYCNSLVLSPSPPMTNSRPETPMSLSESEEDSDLDLSSVFFNIDNLKPPQGDLWDEVLAAVEQEQASGIEIPPLTIIDNDKNNNKKLNSIVSIKDEPLVSIKDEPIVSIKEEPIESIKDEPIDIDEDYISPTKDVKWSPIRLAKSPSVVNSSPQSTLPNNIIAAATTVVSDHSYDKRAWIRLEDLGVQTPSDSEEEIDVVSLIERSRASSRSSSASSRSGSSTSSGGLPTNPSAEEQEEIQVLTTSKLLNAASRAVSRRLRSKITNRSKVNPCKRRLSESDEYKLGTRLPKKPRSCYKSKSRFAADSESDSKEKRDLHNNMERIRRIELRNAFEELKVHVPALLVKERAPKVQILQEAASYCTELKRRSRELTSQVSLLRQEQSKLLKTVSELRRSQFLATQRCSQA